ncbi:MAG TPA: heavy metal translocating P-type ATPase [Candidatus Saccharimonadia bacterium]|nr:heavy metal translocating P-type ATPase [Candidatus Saccharimonadia bacterium]
MKVLRVKTILEILKTFYLPLFVFVSICAALILQYLLQFPDVARWLLLVVVIVGSLPLFKENLLELFHKKYALDYIALLAIIVGVISGQYLVAAIIVLMLAGGTTLEDYGTAKAKQSLTALTHRIPNKVFLWKNEAIGERVANDSVAVGQEIFIRKGEVIPLDGTLVSERGYLDESSLTGEPYTVEKLLGDQIRSGTVNTGDGVVVLVTKVSKDSTYNKIIALVRAAQEEKAPLIRLADKYSTVFTLITLTLSALAFLISHDITRVLAVLVIATPCPLILATPIALMGGMNAAAKRRIIMKKLASIEALSRITTVIFDKTGTITLGKPRITSVRITDTAYTREQLYAIAEAIERNSMHPLANAIVQAAHELKAKRLFAKDVKEELGSGISGAIDGKTYTLSKIHNADGMAIQITHNTKQLAVFEFEDQLKANSREIIQQLKRLGLDILIFTGDKKAAADKIASQLGERVIVKADCSPEDKQIGIRELKKAGKITAMIGDGINDAPALAAADVGIVFSNEEQTAASEAADIVFLAGDFSAVIQVIEISKRTIDIAKQSIFIGIGLSVIGMLFATWGVVPPVLGAFFQEGIDVFVIFNALRASRIK